MEGVYQKGARLVKVIWDDAGGFCRDDSTWRTAAEIVQDYGDAVFIVTTFGYLVYENDDDIVIAQSMAEQKSEDDADQYSNCIRIPRGMIVKITPIHHDAKV